MRRTRLAVSLALTALFAMPVLAQELTGTLKKIKETGAITIGYRESSIPFSYLDDKQQPIGYAMDLCMKVVDAVKAELKMPNLKVNLQPVTSRNRIPLLQNGTIDIECGSTTNSVERQKQVAFGPTYFVINVTAAVKKIVRHQEPRRPERQDDLDDVGHDVGAAAEASTRRRRTSTSRKSTARTTPSRSCCCRRTAPSAFVMDDILLAGPDRELEQPGRLHDHPASRCAASRTA